MVEGPVVLGHSGLCSFASLVRLAHVPVLGLAWSVVHTGYEVCCMLRCGVSVMCEDTSCEYACELITGLWRNRQVLLVVAIQSTGATAACSLVYLQHAALCICLVLDLRVLLMCLSCLTCVTGPVLSHPCTCGHFLTSPAVHSSATCTLASSMQPSDVASGGGGNSARCHLHGWMHTHQLRLWTTVVMLSISIGRQVKGTCVVQCESVP